MIQSVINGKPYRLVQTSAYLYSRGMRNGDIVYLAHDKGDAAPIFWLNRKMWFAHGLVSYADATRAIELGLADCIYKGRLEAVEEATEDVLPNTPYMLMEDIAGLKQGDVMYLAYDDHTSAPAFWLPQVSPRAPMTITDWYNDQSFGRNNSITLDLDYFKQMVITDPSMEVKETEEPNTDDGDEGEEVDMYYDTYPDTDVNTHYACVAVQPIEVMQSNMTHEQFVGFLRGNIIKYTCRMGRKDDVTKEAAKIKQYATWLEQTLRGEKVQWKS